MRIFTIIILLALLVSCKQETKTTLQINKETPLELIAESDKLWTGLAVSKEGRIFVNFPRWSKDVTVSVGEIVDGEVVPYPNKELNTWSMDMPFGENFVCVQSVYVDNENYLWILDPSNPYFEGVINNEAKLYKVDLVSNEIVKTFTYDTTVIRHNSYLNDVRIDTEKKFAYITDSGVGALVVTNLETGESMRFLEGEYSVKASFDHLVFGDNKIPFEVDADGIALNNDRSYLYYTPLSSHTLYRIKTEYLRNGFVEKEQVEVVTLLDAATDGMMFDYNNNLFMGGLEKNAVYVYKNDEELVQLFQDERIKWADSFTKDIDGNMYFTTSQLHIPAENRGKYCIYKINLK